MCLDTHMRAEICHDTGDLLLQLIADLAAAERAVFEGSAETELLLEFIRTTGETVVKLETAYDILLHSITHGPGPYEVDELALTLPHDPATIAQVLDRLATRGLIHPPLVESLKPGAQGTQNPRHGTEDGAT